jgi:hypothetical protein
MLAKSLRLALLLACTAIATVNLANAADDKKDDKKGLSGTWGKKDAELKIEFAEKDVMKIAPHGDPAVINIICSYTLEKEGKVKAKITDFEGKEEVKKQIQQQIPVGYTFSFKWAPKDGTAKLEEVTGQNADHLKSHLEGEFEKK